MNCSSCKANNTNFTKENGVNEIKKSTFLKKMILFFLVNIGLLIVYPFIIFLLPFFSYKIIFSKKGLNFNFTSKKNESKS